MCHCDQRDIRYTDFLKTFIVTCAVCFRIFFQMIKIFDKKQKQKP